MTNPVTKNIGANGNENDNIKRWKIILEYDGTPYYGWQKQDNVPSVQVEVENALSKFCGEEIAVTASGRTDAGVHAYGQVAHFDLDFRYQKDKRAGQPRALSPYELIRGLNAHLRPAPISVVKAEITDREFHARFSAKKKHYRYRILNRLSPAVLERDRAWHVGKALDVEAMQKGAKHLLGQHDFSSFRDSDCQGKSPIKTLDNITITSRPYADTGGQDIHIDVEGQSFLHHMVRNIAGTLKLVGEGKWAPDDVLIALKAADRTQGGPTAPAQGLYLLKVEY